MKFGVIGLGIGAVHARVMSAMPDVELVGICDLNPERLAAISAETGAPGFDSWEEMLEVAQPEAVSVCTNPKLHLPLGKALAERGIHVLCEKPMAPSYAEAVALAQACEAAGVTLGVAQKKRFTLAAAFMKEHLFNDFGAPRSFNYRYQPGQVPMDWFWAEDDGGGPIVENAVHVMDSLRYLIGEIKSIRGIGGNFFNPKHPNQVDVALGLLEFENGCVGAVELGTASEWCVADEEFHIACDNAVVRWRGGFDNPSEICWILRDNQELQTYQIDYSGAMGTRDFEAEIRDLMTCAQTGGTTRASGYDAARSVACCQALKQAIRENCVVELPA